MKKILLILLFTVVTNYAQVTREWLARYNGPGNGGDASNSVLVDTSGNIYVTGNSTGNGTGSDYATIKYNSAGVLQWVRRYNGPANGEDYTSSIAIDQLGNVYVTGLSFGIGTSADYATIKYNSTGTQLWVARYNGADNDGDEAKSIAVDQNGNVYITGNSDGGINFHDYTTIKYDSLGVEQWVRHYNGSESGSDIPVALLLDQAGNVYVSGTSDGNENGDFATIKYSPSGAQQWVARYEAPGNNGEITADMALDSSGNVYVTGYSYGNGANVDYATVKYNSSGVEQWVAEYNGPENDYANSIAVDTIGNVYVTGDSDGIIGSVSDFDYATIKYNSSGVQQWVERYNGPVNGYDESKSVTVDNNGNIYVTGLSIGNGSNYDYANIKYNSLGVQQWVERFNALANSGDQAESVVTDQYGNVYVTGTSVGNGTFDYLTLKYSQQSILNITSPLAGEKWIAGETDTIRWTGGQAGKYLTVEYSIDDGATYSQIDTGVPADSNYYVWTIPKTILSTKVKIKLTDVVDPLKTVVTDAFKIKGYTLTTLFPNGNYDPYDIMFDPWSFGNTPTPLWDPNYYNQFNYQGIDPFTNSEYPQYFGGSVFREANSSDFPDWPFFVNTFGVNACYKDISFGIYSPTALAFWESIKGVWEGSCFGMAVSNFLYFSHKNEFINKYPDLPDQPAASFLSPTNYLISIINELWVHQLGTPHRESRIIAYSKTPNETLNEIRDMLLEENFEHKILDFWNNNVGGGAHAVSPYRVERDTVNPDRYFVYIYDNSNFLNLNSRFIIDITGNNGNGTWTNIEWQTWGGNNRIGLVDPVTNYLSNPTLPKTQEQKKNHFAIGGSYIDIWNTIDASIIIKDQAGNQIGYSDSLLIQQMPDAFPFIPATGSETPPYGYTVPMGNYSIQMKDFSDTTSRVSFFLQNSVFSFKRNDASTSQSDKIYFDDGLSFSNPDIFMKMISMTNILNEEVQEKMFSISSLSMQQTDSLKIYNQNSDDLNIANFGSSKNYGLEIEIVSNNNSGTFINPGIILPQNSSHILMPDWNELSNSTLMILLDEGNNGTIDDTLEVENLYDPLPVELISFTGKYFDGGVRLDWKTATEVSNFGFEVERKLKVKDDTTGVWSKIGFVAGNGNSNSPKSYSFQDNNISGNLLYYRLKQIDTDGWFEYSNIIEVSNMNPLEFKLEQNYPNPFNPSTTISCSIPNSSFVTIKVYDVLGNEIAQLVNEEKSVGVHEVTFDASNLSTGTYFYHLQAGSFVETKKMLLLK